MFAESKFGKIKVFTFLPFKIEKGNIPASQKDPEPSENKTDVTQTATDKTKPTDQNEVEEKTEVTKEETVDKSSDVEPKEKN